MMMMMPLMMMMVVARGEEEENSKWRSAQATIFAQRHLKLHVIRLQ